MTKAEFKLPQNAPGLHNDAMQAVLSGNLHTSKQAFNDYWVGQSMDPAAMAAKLGVTFSVDAATGREYAEVPTANYFGKLATKDQKGLASNVIAPGSELTLSQYQALQQWAASGGPAKLQAQLAQNNREIVSTPEEQTATGDSAQQDVEAGLTPENGGTPTTNALTTSSPDAPAQASPQTAATPDEQMATEGSPRMDAEVSATSKDAGTPATKTAVTVKPVNGKMSPAEKAYKEELEGQGHEVIRNPEGDHPTADFTVDRKEREYKKVTANGPDSIKNAIEDATKQTASGDIVVDARESAATIELAMEQIIRAEGNLTKKKNIAIKGRVTVLTKSGSVKY